MRKLFLAVVLLSAAAWAQQTNQNNFPGTGGTGGTTCTGCSPGQLVVGASGNSITGGDLSGDANTAGTTAVTVTGASGTFTANGAVTGASFNTPSGSMMFSGLNIAHTGCPVTSFGGTAFCATNDVGGGDALSVSIDGNLYNPIMYAAGAATIGNLIMGVVTPPPVTALTTSTLSGSLAAGTYYYWVSATNGTGNNVGESLVGSNAFNPATLGATGNINTTWTPEVGATGYCIYRNTSNNSATASQIACVNGGITSGYVDNGTAGITSASITAWSITSNVVTFTASNSFAAGQNVILSAFGTSTFFNGQQVVVLAAGLSGSQFEANFTHANGSGTETGTAAVPVPQTVNRTDNLVFDRLISSSPTAPNFNGSILLGQSDPIVAGTGSSTVTTTCGSQGQKCIQMLQQSGGMSALGDQWGARIAVNTVGAGLYFRQMTAPSNPSLTNDMVLYADSGSTTLKCLTHSGGNCLPSGGTVTTTGSPASGQMTAFSGASSITTATGHNLVGPIACADSSGSATAQSCSTAPTFTPASGDAIIYSTTTTNTGDLTVNVNATSAIHVRKFLAQSTLSANDLPANVPVLMIYDGTYWELATNNLSLAWAGDGSDGAVEATTSGSGLNCIGTAAASTYTLTRDCYFTTFIVDSSVIIKTNGFRILATVSITSAGTFNNAGANAAAAGNASGTNKSTGGSAGGSGTAGAGGTLPGGLAGVGGKLGTTGTTGAGAAGTAGTTGTGTNCSILQSVAASGVAGGGGGTGSGGGGGTGGAAGTHGTTSFEAWVPVHDPHIGSTMYDPSGCAMVSAGTIGGAGSGASGGGDGTNNGGGGGGSGGTGGSGGIIVLIAPVITLNTGSAFTVGGGNGGAGGSGGTPTTGNCGGGGGGAGGGGGNGGVIVRIYRMLNNNSNTDTTSGGSGGGGGSLGTGVGSGTNGTGGNTGPNGVTGYVYNIALP